MNRTLIISADAIREINEKKEPKQQSLQVEQLYCDHYDQLKAFLMSRARDKELVNVILQDVYLRLMDMKDLSVIVTPAAYLNRMANNLLIDYQRRQTRQQQRFHDEPVEQLDIAELKPSLYEQTLYTQQLAAYDRILSELPPPAGEILFLNRVEGLTYNQIAKKFGKSKSWVEKNVAKTLVHCRKVLQEFEQ